MTYLLLASFAIAFLLSSIQVLAPVLLISWNIHQFKKKALFELDPFIYNEVIRFAQDTSSGTKNTESSTTLVFMLRQFIADMKTFPINIIKILTSSGAIFAVIRFMPDLLKIFA